MSGQKPPKAGPKPVDERLQFIFDSKMDVFEFEVKESLGDRDFKRIKTLFRDIGEFLQRHPEVVVHST